MVEQNKAKKNEGQEDGAAPIQSSTPRPSKTEDRSAAKKDGAPRAPDRDGAPVPALSAPTRPRRVIDVRSPRPPRPPEESQLARPAGAGEPTTRARHAPDAPPP